MPKRNENLSINEDIGRRIKEVREEKGLKQDYLAEKTRVNRPNISKYETGERAIPLDVLAKISSILGTSADYLLGLTECKTPRTNYRALCDATGIDDTAVEILEENNLVYGGKHILPIINFLVKQEQLPPDEAFFEEKYRQIEDSKMADKEKKKYIRKVQSIYDRMYRRWKEKNYIPLLCEIENYIIAEAEDENLYLMLSGKLKREKEITNDTEKLHIRKKISKQELLDEMMLEEITEDLKKLKQKYNEQIKK